MNTLAVSLELSPSGFLVRNGAAALWSRDRQSLVSVAEERTRRVKAAPGWKSSTRALIHAAKLTPLEINTVLVVGCAGTAAEYRSVAIKEGISEWFPRASIEVIGHHEAHATLAAVHAGLTRSLILVNDCGGDLTDARTDVYWRLPREQGTVWRWEDGTLSPLGSLFDDPTAWGLGEFYRAVTHLLGFKSQVWSAKVMALAGHSQHKLAVPFPFDVHRGRIQSSLGGDPRQAASLIAMWLAPFGFASKQCPSMDDRIALAGWAQATIENVVTKVAKYFVSDQSDVEGIALAGGVSLNCTMIGRLPSLIHKKVVVPFAAGDTGLAIGAILKVHPAARLVYTRERRYLGPVYSQGNCLSPARLAEVAFASSRPIAVCAGRSELGPRSLGSRSLLCRASDAVAVDRLRYAKRREWFQPFAVSILRRDAEALFEIPPTVELDGMTACVWSKGTAAAALAGGVHVDGSSRIQVVEEDENSILAQILRNERAAVGVGAVINTSLNAPGNVMAETFDDACREADTLGVKLLART